MLLACFGTALHAQPGAGDAPDRSRILWTEKKNPPPLPGPEPPADQVRWAQALCRQQEPMIPGIGLTDDGKDYNFPWFKFEWLPARPGSDKESAATLVAASGPIRDIHDPDSCERLELCCNQMTITACSTDGACPAGHPCGACPPGDRGCNPGDKVCLAPGGKDTGTDEQRRLRAVCLGIVRTNIGRRDGYQVCGPQKYQYYNDRACNLGGDVPLSHPFGDDWSAQMVNAPQYQDLMAPTDTGCVPAPECPPARRPFCIPCPDGLLKSDANPNGVAVSTDSIDVRSRTGSSSMHFEWEKNMLPRAFFPREGDDLAVFGRHIVDCGHDNYTAEVHPPLLVASARPSNTGGTESKLMARNYFNSQTFRNYSSEEGLARNLALELVEAFFLTRYQLTMEVGTDFAAPFQGDFTGDGAIEYFVQPREERHNPFDQLQATVRVVERSGVDVRIADAKPDLDGMDAIKVRVELKESEYAAAWRRSILADPLLMATVSRVLTLHDFSVIDKEYAWLADLEPALWGFIGGLGAISFVNFLCFDPISCLILEVGLANVARVIADGVRMSFFTNRDPAAVWAAAAAATQPLCPVTVPALSKGIRKDANDVAYPVLGEIGLEWKRWPQPKAVVAGMRSTCALMDNGTVKCWGANDRGQLGTGDTVGQMKPGPPVIIPLTHLQEGAAGPPGLPLGEGGDPVVQLAAGKDASPAPAAAATVFAVTRSGLLYGWGSNFYGGLGIGIDKDLDPHPFAELINGPGTAIAKVRFRQVAAGAQHACALSTRGEVYCWGPNTVGQLGPGTVPPGPGKGSSSPLKVQLSGELVELAAGDFHTCARRRDGNAVCWGWNANGRLGDGTGTTPANPPVTVKLPPGSAARVVAGGSAAGAIGCVPGTSCAQKTVALWGDNTKGKLGDGTATDRLAPVTALLPPPASSVPFAFDVGPGHACAVVQGAPPGPAGRSVYCWGANDKGQVDASGTDPVLTPVEVSGWQEPGPPFQYRDFHPRKRGLGAVAVGGAHSCVMGEAMLKDYVFDASPPRNAYDAPVVMCWGDNSSGQLGNNSTVSSAKPVVVRLEPPGCLCRFGVEGPCDDVYAPMPEPPDDSEPGCFNPCTAPDPTRPMAPYCDGLEHLDFEDVTKVPAGHVCGALDACCESPKLSASERDACRAIVIAGGTEETARSACAKELRTRIAGGQCDSCVTEVCGLDPTCCTLGWDAGCAARAGLFKSCQSKCGFKPAQIPPLPPPIPPKPQPPGESGPECTNEHTACEAGSKAMSWMCNSCAKAVCQINPYCCDVPQKGGTKDTGLRQLTDEDEAAFGRGAHAGTKAVKLARGEVTLASPVPTIRLDFPADRKLPADWESRSVGGPAPALDGDGNLAVTGAFYAAKLAGEAPQRLEIGARLARKAGQWIGLSLKIGPRDFAQHYFRVADASGGGLVVEAVSHDGPAAKVTPAGAPGTLLDEWHTYTLTYEHARVVFAVDGRDVAEHAVSSEASLRPAISDPAPDGESLRVRTVTVTPYRGVFTSRAFDAGAEAVWGYLTSRVTAPPGTAVRFEMGAGSTPGSVARWTPVQPGRPADAQGRYARYRAILEASPAAFAAGKLPVLERVTAEYGTNLGQRDWNMACRQIADTIPQCGCNAALLQPAIKSGGGGVARDETELFSLETRPEERLRVTLSPEAKASLDLCVKRSTPPDDTDHARWQASCDAVATGAGTDVTLDYAVPRTAAWADRLFVSVYGTGAPRATYRLDATRDHFAIVPGGSSGATIAVRGKELRLYGPFPTPAGARLEVNLTGSNDADLYVGTDSTPRRVSSPVATPSLCVPYLRGTSSESCTLTMPSGGSDFTDVYVGIAGMDPGTSNVTLEMKTVWTENIPTGSGKLYKVVVPAGPVAYFVAEGKTAGDDIDLLVREGRSPLDYRGGLTCATDRLCKSYPHAHPATVNAWSNGHSSPVVLYIYASAVRGGAYRLEVRPKP